METVAIYKESTIRTYGFALTEGATLHQIHLPTERLAHWGCAMEAISDQGSLFRLVWAQSHPADTFTFCMVCDDTFSEGVAAFLESTQHDSDDRWEHTATPVDLLVFQGPHFGDRNGIMAYTYNSLAKAQVLPLATVCSVATIALVFDAGQGAVAKEVLTEAFEIPMEKRVVE